MVVSYQTVPLDQITNCSGKFTVKENDKVYGQKWINKDFEQPTTIPAGAIYEFAYNAELNYTYITVLSTVTKGYLSEIAHITIGSIEADLKRTNSEFTDGAGPHRMFNIAGDIFNLANKTNEQLKFMVSW